MYKCISIISLYRERERHKVIGRGIGEDTDVDIDVDIVDVAMLLIHTDAIINTCVYMHACIHIVDGTTVSTDET